MNRLVVAMVFAAAMGLASSSSAADDAPAAPAAAAAAKPAAKAAAKKTAILAPAADIKWSPLMPNMADGPQVAFVKGSAKSKGWVSFFLKFPKDFNSGLHTHNSDYQAAVISGTMTNQMEGEADDKARQMGPGSWWFEPGMEKHFNRCVSADGCVVFVAVSGPFSFNPVGDAAKPDAAPAEAPKPDAAKPAAPEAPK
jgi:hypothetical protein